MAFYKSIKFRLFALVSFILFLLLVITLFSYHSYRSQLDNIHLQQVQNLVEQIKREQQQFIFTKDVTHAQLYDSLYERYMHMIKPYFESGDLQVAAIYRQMQTMNGKFIQVRQKLKERGLTENEGLEGSFRRRIHLLEEWFTRNGMYEKQILLLQLRRNEKDYFLRRKERYVMAVDSIARTIINRSDNMIEQQLVSDYQEEFSKVVQINKEIAWFTEELNQELITTQAVLTKINRNMERKAEKFENIIIVASLVTLGLGIILVFIIYISISRRLNEIIGAANKLARGNYDINLDVKSRDEIGLVSASFCRMRDEIMKSHEKLEKALEEAKQMAKAKTTFLANMSHEIRTPMNSILGFAELLGNSPLGKEQREYIRALDFSAKHLLSLINQVLDYSKLEAGKSLVEVSDINLEVFLNNQVNMFSPRAEKKKLKLILENHVNLKYYIRSDNIKLTEVLSNLLDNAIKFTEQGQVSLVVKLLSEEAGRMLLQFSISDTGIGIEAQKMDRIFEEFIQADLATTRRYGGTGLGLAITKKLVELMGGNIRVESSYGEGSTFVVIIPVQRGIPLYKSIVQHLEEEGGSSFLKGKKALVVDDERINQMLNAEILRLWEVQTWQAFDGEEAVKIMAERQDIDFVLMDLHMPVMDGKEATALIRRMPGDYYKGLPILALTANVTSEAKEEMIAAGVNAYLIKPLGSQQLLEALHLFMAEAITLP